MKEITGRSKPESRELLHSETRPQMRESRNSELVSKKEVKKSSEVADGVFDSAIKSILSKHGSVMPEEQRVRIDIERESKRPTVLSEGEYISRFPNHSLSVLGHCDSEGNVYLKAGDEARIKHVTTHEAMHFGSYREVDDSNRDLTVFRSGLRETHVSDSGVQRDINMGINEGTTEMYTLRELSDRGDFAAALSVNAYPSASEWATILENEVGGDRLEGAYFGGDTKGLEATFNRMHFNDETAWRRFSSDVDIVEYSDNPDERQAAQSRLSLHHAIMESYKLSSKEQRLDIDHSEERKNG